MRYIGFLLLIFLCTTTYGDYYKKLENCVVKYELISKQLNEIKTEGNALYEGLKITKNEYDDLKTSYNKKYEKFIDTGYLLEEIIIMEGELSINDMIVPMSERRESINQLGLRKYNKTTKELLFDVNSNLKILSAYIGEVFRFYGQAKKR